MKEQLEKFMLESNMIENEDGLNPNDIIAAEKVVTIGITSLQDILDLHYVVAAHLDVDWKGKWRECNVRVGSYRPPAYPLVPSLMMDFWDNFNTYNSWLAHNNFESIHPFRDFNGRIGRLIWLAKAVKEGYNFNRSFLHSYYYQTLMYSEGSAKWIL